MGTAITPTVQGQRVDLVKIKLVKGGDIEDRTLETFSGGMFTPSKYDAAGNNLTTGTSAKLTVNEIGFFDKTNIVRQPRALAALGIRGDYFEIIASGISKGTNVAAENLRSLILDLVDISSVPEAAQYMIYGRNGQSPFESPIMAVSKGMSRGINVQEIQAEYNVVVTADDTYKDQLIRGISSDRIQVKVLDIAGVTTGNAFTLTMKMKPESNGVFLIRRGAQIWAGYGEGASIGYALV